MIIWREIGRAWVYRMDKNGHPVYVPSSTPAAQYAAGLVQPRYPVPSLIGGVSIQAHIVDVIGPKQTRPIAWETDDYISMDSEGWTPTLAHWWSDGR